MASKDKNISKLLRKYGYAFPITEDEVGAYEKKHKGTYSVPHKWPDLSEIINDENGKNKEVIKLNNFENKSTSNLAMAAREGKKINKEDRERMDKDKRDARKK